LHLPYPKRRKRYNWDVGQTRVENIAQAIRSLGFTVRTNPVQAHGVDIWVYNSREDLILVIEVLNWQIFDCMSRSKAESIQRNFRDHKCSKLLVVSYDFVLVGYEDYIDPDVDVIEFGFQTQPYYDYFEGSIEQAEMRPNDEETKAIEAIKIREYLVSKGFINEALDQEEIDQNMTCLGNRE
jgi:hypothetical protein